MRLSKLLLIKRIPRCLRRGSSLILLFHLFNLLLAEEIESSGKIEVSLITDYINFNSTYDFIVTSVGSCCWDWDKYLTEDFEDASLSDIPEQPDSTRFAYYGWNFYGTSLPDYPLTKQYSNICYGLYKFKWNAVYGSPPYETIVSDSFYYDFRDDRYPDGPYSTNDTQIKFDENLDSNRFYIRNSNSSSSFNRICTGDTVTQWGVVDVDPPPSCDEFQPTTPSDLTVSWSNNRPLLTWNCSVPSDTATYEVWRKVMGGFRYLQTIEDWTCIHNNQAEDTTYSDNGFTSGSGYKAFYKIRAVSGDGNLYSPAWSNTVSVTGSFTPNSRSQQFKVVELDPLPTEFCLHSAYPNPFNTTTTLKLDLPEETRFSLVIYDISGKEVWCLNNSRSNTYPAGYHTIQWDGCNKSGMAVPTGVYFIVNNSPQHKLNQKVVLVK